MGLTCSLVVLGSQYTLPNFKHERHLYALLLACQMHNIILLMRISCMHGPYTNKAKTTIYKTLVTVLEIMHMSQTHPTNVQNVCLHLIMISIILFQECQVRHYSRKMAKLLNMTVVHSTRIFGVFTVVTHIPYRALFVYFHPLLS